MRQIVGVAGEASIARLPPLTVPPNLVRARDTFSRADGVLGNAETGQAWSVLGGTWDISGNRARCVVVNTNVAAVIDVGSPDHSVTVTYQQLATWGLAVRVTDINNYYHVSTNQFGEAFFYRQVNGAFTSTQSLSPGFAVGDKITYEVIGTTHRLLKNGTQVFTYQDSTITTGNKAGLQAYNGTTYYDDLEIAVP